MFRAPPLPDPAPFHGGEGVKAKVSRLAQTVENDAGRRRKVDENAIRVGLVSHRCNLAPWWWISHQGRAGVQHPLRISDGPGDFLGAVRLRDRQLRRGVGGWRQDQRAVRSDGDAGHCRIAAGGHNGAAVVAEIRTIIGGVAVEMDIPGARPGEGQIVTGIVDIGEIADDHCVLIGGGFPAVKFSVASFSGQRKLSESSNATVP